MRWTSTCIKEGQSDSEMDSAMSIADLHVFEQIYTYASKVEKQGLVFKMELRFTLGGSRICQALFPDLKTDP